ncbi:MAG: hypothetical protein OXC41_08345 [Gammaproteobacteria bacterium]|nr:hypothetical protein [Gammaproteobacteria bacterium]
MNLKTAYILVTVLLACQCISVAYTADLNSTITISSNEKFELLHGESIAFEFKSLSSKARMLESTKDASSLGIAYLGQLRLKENATSLAALRIIANQIGKSLGLKFSVVADSNTSEALKANNLLLLYHTDIVITLALAKPVEQDHYEIICTYAVREINPQQPDSLEHLKPVQDSSSTDSDTPSGADKNRPG